MCHTNVDAKLLLGACEKYMEKRTERIRKEREELIHIRMTQRQGFLGWKGYMTRDQAESDILEEMYWVKVTGNYWATKAKELIALCKLAKEGETVVINGEIAEWISEYY